MNRNFKFHNSRKSAKTTFVSKISVGTRTIDLCKNETTNRPKSHDLILEPTGVPSNPNTINQVNNNIFNYEGVLGLRLATDIPHIVHRLKRNVLLD